MCSLLSGKQRISSIQRYLKNKHKFLCQATGFKAEKVISDVQLRRVLSRLDWSLFNDFMEEYFGISVSELADNEWIAVDGKELRGSIETAANGKKDKRGTTLLDAVAHRKKMVVAQSFFEGKKDSERTAVSLLISEKLVGRKLTLDALHSIPKTLCQIEEGKGEYLVQVKTNQLELYTDLAKMPDYLPIIYQMETVEKAHGRVDERFYTCYDINAEYFDARWKGANIQTLIVVKRKSTDNKTKIVSEEISYYIGNQRIRKKNTKLSHSLCIAVRKHWEVENQHQIRDVTLKEDYIKTPKGNTTKILAVMRSWVINMYRKRKTANFAEAVQATNDNHNKIFKLFSIK